MKVTRIAYSTKMTEVDDKQLRELARRLGILRSEIWNEYGSLKGVGRRHREIRDLWLQSGKSFNVPARLWKETLRDVMDDISAYREAAKRKVRKKVAKRDKDSQKSLYTALKFDTWTTDSFLRRQMRKHFRHGHTSVRNQIVLDSGCYTSESHNGKACLHVTGLVKRERIVIPLSTNRMPEGTLRLVLKDGRVEVHHTVEVAENCVTRPPGAKTLGVDKGYTEAFTDSEGDRHGTTLGAEIGLFTPYREVKSILLRRTESRLGLLSQDSSCALSGVNGERITDNFL